MADLQGHIEVEYTFALESWREERHVGEETL